MTYRWLWLICLLLPFAAAASTVSAVLDRNEAHLGETVTLQLHVNGTVDINTPDLSALDNDFEVLGVSPASMVDDVNGRTTMAMVIGIVLRPKHVGDLQIPTLNIAGNQTNPLTLHVDPPDKASSDDSAKDFIVDVSVEPGHAYVGQQVALTVRLFYATDINGGSLPAPQPNDGATVYPLGQDVDYEAMRNGRRYHVVERRYALIPQRAGTLTIPSIEFQGEAVDAANPNNPGSLIGGFLADTRPVSADSSPVTVDVQAVPADWGSISWLPAQSLTLNVEGLPSDDKAQVGQPINVHMSIQALGLSGDVLPELSLPAIDGATVYPDQSTTSNRSDGQWLTGSRQRGFAIFPQHPGALTIPAISLTWFNVQTNQKQVVTIPARTLNVLPAAGGVPAISSSAALAAASVPSLSAPASAANTNASPAPALVATSTLWRWIAIGSLGLWVLSALVFWWSRRRRRASKEQPSSDPTRSDSTRALRQDFMQAVRGKDRSVQARRLLAWARGERSGLRNLGQLSSALSSDAQRSAIDYLQRSQYAAVSAEDTIDLAAAFAKGFAWRNESDSNQDSPLPPLYPFKLD